MTEEGWTLAEQGADTTPYERNTNKGPKRCRRQRLLAHVPV
jgi:hypothetical protein